MSEHERWISRGEVWGRWLTHPQLAPAGREEVFMVRGGNGHARFYAPGRSLGGSGLRQVGPDFPSIVAATYWAYGEQWIDPDCPAWLNHAATVEVWNSRDPRGRQPIEAAA